MRKVVASLRISGDRAQVVALQRTVKSFNEGCLWLHERMGLTRTQNERSVKNTMYHALKNYTGLKSAHVNLAISKVWREVNLDSLTPPQIHEFDAMPCDKRVYKIKEGFARLSFLTIYGRVTVPCLLEAFYAAAPTAKQGQGCLLCDDGVCRLNTVIQISADSPVKLKSPPQRKLGKCISDTDPNNPRPDPIDEFFAGD